MSRKLRAAGYCRTSSERQRDNTSIPTQKRGIEDLAERNDWRFVSHYVDECRSGSKIEGRVEFQRMMRDAAAGKFDVLIAYDIDRFSRDGVDILDSARTLKRDFQVEVLDTKGRFDTRDPNNLLMQFVSAGMAQTERLKTLERTTRGRMAKAREGKPWCPSFPIGRQYDKKSGWSVSEFGVALQALLTRYVEGELLTPLCREFGIVRRQKISDWIYNGQLAGEYQASFHSPAIDINHVKISVPDIPEVISQELLEKVKAKLFHNRRQSRPDVQKYLLTGFVRCAHCGRSMTGQMQNPRKLSYYRHNCSDATQCPMKAVRQDQLEPAILEYLYGKFLDEPSFNRAVEKALPAPGQRRSLDLELDQTKQRLMNTENSIARLVDAIAEGADVELMLAKQEELKATRDSLRQRLDQMETEIAQFPDVAAVKTAAMLVRISLIQQHTRKDWRSLSYADVQRFLLHLFGPRKREGANGIFISRDERGRLHVQFKGQVEIERVFVSDKSKRAVTASLSEHVDALNSAIRSRLDRSIAAAERELAAGKRKLKPLRSGW
jgi:site-specific DNA recombinase